MSMRPIRPEGWKKPVIDFSKDQGRTKSEFAHESEINVIVRKYQRQGIDLFNQKYEAQYGEISPFDLQEAFNMVERANGMFRELPAELRKRFNFNPAEFLEFVQDVGNRDEAIRLGLIDAPPPPADPPPAPE